MNYPRVIVSAIIERWQNGQKEVYTQTRYKLNSSNYLGMLEIPAGNVEPYENVFDALKREVFEETGLEISAFIDSDIPLPLENRKGDESIAFKPYLCQQVLKTNGGLPWYGFVFRCHVQGIVKINLDEAKDPRWLTLPELANFLKTTPQNVFPLHYATLLKYLKENNILIASAT